MQVFLSLMHVCSWRRGQLHVISTSSIHLFLCPTSAGSYWHILGNCHDSEHLNFWGCCSLYQGLLPVTHGALKCQSCATLAASLPFWTVFFKGLSERYWLLLSYLRGLGGKWPFLILGSQLSPFPRRDIVQIWICRELNREPSQVVSLYHT